ncbi:MAG: hypothetical protein PHO08_14915 [Methylococcales bacterium]|nr:hypothetical protein [Methylococcales bacterium]MDD5630962.1 hypothetical protein [Methylococcales bacterium]
MIKISTLIPRKRAFKRRLSIKDKISFVLAEGAFSKLKISLLDKLDAFLRFLYKTIHRQISRFSVKHNLKKKIQAIEIMVDCGVFKL